MWHAKNFIKIFQKEFQARPTGAVDTKDYFEFVKEKYADALEKMQALSPPDNASPADKLQLQQAQQRVINIHSLTSFKMFICENSTNHWTTRRI